VHSADVALVESDPGAVAPEVDAMVDPTASAVPMVLTADCVPVVFAARRPDGSSLTAVAHAGRKGLLAGVLSETVAVVQEHGGDAIEAWIGPSICGECYEVPEDMAQAAESVRPGIAATTSWGTASLDLPGAAQRELECLGVRTHRVECCTLTDPDYHSYRGGDLRARNASMVIRLAAPTP
jgi:copper oxidase (laccase) domain-containing protein